LLVDDNTATNTEVVRIGSIDAGVSFTLDSDYSPLGLLYTYTSGAHVYADGTPRVGDLYAVYRWINDNVDEIVATRETGASEGTLPPTNIAYTYLAGGSDGAADLTTLADALTALQDEDVNFILVESENAAWHAAVKAHCLSTDNFSPRQLVCGGASAETVAARKLRAYNLNSDAAYLVAEGHYDYTITGESTELLSPMYSAALVAGVAAGLEVQDPPTRKAINCIGIENNYEKADREDFINAGCITFRRLPSGFVITQAISTVQTNLQLWDRAGNQTCEMSLARIRNQFMHEFKLDADALVPGANPRRLTKGVVETLVVSHLSAAVRKGWFAAVAPDAQHPLGQPAYDAPVIYKELDAWYVELSARFANPNNFCFFTLKVIG
jgi:hypothetical protein